MSETIDVTVNGEPQRLAEGATIATVVDAMADRRGLAVAVNGDIAPRSTWDSCTLTDGDHLEVLTAVQGG